ncbi:helix-turn-helix transcriptional regulator [Streptomyces virginiae]|uniref:helix-turn-helix domain-containing protein n=1 Tax=Streptomyces virginiae TaxID=1961 RepID=UPI0033A0BCDC
MGRPEKPIVTDNKPLRELAEGLRERRRWAGQPSYRELARMAGVHATTLQRAASGDTVPKLHVVLAYLRACTAPEGSAVAKWKEARQVQARARRGRPPHATVSPLALVRDFADLSAQLQQLYERAGSPTLREMEQRAGGYGVLPRSTAHRIVTRQAVPHSIAQFRAFLQACEVPVTSHVAWEDAWSRAWRHEKSDAFPVEVTRVPSTKKDDTRKSRRPSNVYAYLSADQTEARPVRSSRRRGRPPAWRADPLPLQMPGNSFS